MSANILIVGAGAVGKVIAAKLCINDQHPSLLARSNFTTLQQHGLQFHTPTGKTTLIPACEYEALDATSPQEPKAWDIIILTTQTTQNTEHIKNTCKLLAEDGTLISLQNGFDFETEIYQHLKENQQLISGTAWVKCTTLKDTAEGAAAVQHNFGNDIMLSTYKPNYSIPRDKRFDTATNYLKQADFNIIHMQNPQAAQWTKLVFNIPFFICSCIYTQSATEALVSNESRENMLEIRAELLCAAKQAKINVDIEYIHKMTELLKNMKVSAPASKNIFIQRMKEELRLNAGTVLAFLDSKNIEAKKLHKAYKQALYPNPNAP